MATLKDTLPYVDDAFRYLEARFLEKARANTSPRDLRSSLAFDAAEQGRIGYIRSLLGQDATVGVLLGDHAAAAEFQRRLTWIPGLDAMIPAARHDAKTAVGVGLAHRTAQAQLSLPAAAELRVFTRQSSSMTESQYSVDVGLIVARFVTDPQIAALFMEQDATWHSAVRAFLQDPRALLELATHSEAGPILAAVPGAVERLDGDERAQDAVAMARMWNVTTDLRSMRTVKFGDDSPGPPGRG